MFKTFIMTGALAGLVLGATTAKADFGISVGGRRGGVGVTIGDRDRHYYHHHHHGYYPRRYYVAPAPVIVPRPIYVQQPVVVPSQPVYVAPPAQPPVYVAPPSSTQQSYYTPADAMVRYRGDMPSGPVKYYVVRHPYTGANVSFKVPAWREPRKVEWNKNEFEMKYDRGEVEVRFDRDGSAVVRYDF